MWVNIGKAVLVAVLTEIIEVLVEDKKKYAGIATSDIRSLKHLHETFQL